MTSFPIPCRMVPIRCDGIWGATSGSVIRYRQVDAPIRAAAFWLGRYSRYGQARFDLRAMSLEDIEREKSATAGKPRRGGTRLSPPAEAGRRLTRLLSDQTSRGRKATVAAALSASCQALS